jgi:hypothetical protein
MGCDVGQRGRKNGGGIVGKTLRQTLSDCRGIRKGCQRGLSDSAAGEPLLRFGDGATSEGDFHEALGSVSKVEMTTPMALI